MTRPRASHLARLLARTGTWSLALAAAASLAACAPQTTHLENDIVHVRWANYQADIPLAWLPSLPIDPGRVQGRLELQDLKYFWMELELPAVGREHTHRPTAISRRDPRASLHLMLERDRQLPISQEMAMLLNSPLQAYRGKMEGLETWQKLECPHRTAVSAPLPAVNTRPTEADITAAGCTLTNDITRMTSRNPDAPELGKVRCWDDICAMEWEYRGMAASLRHVPRERLADIRALREYAVRILDAWEK